MTFELESQAGAGEVLRQVVTYLERVIRRHARQIQECDRTVHVRLALLPDGVREVFRHLADHGTINEQEATRLLGGARQFRNFSLHLDDFRHKVPFAVRIDVSSGTKCYVRGDQSC